MRKLTTTVSLVMLLAVSAQPVAALELPGPLVQTDWLAANLQDENLVILNVRTDPALFTYTPAANAPFNGHIPGARLWNNNNVRQSRVMDGIALDKMVLTPENFQAQMRTLGVDNDSAVVIVANNNDTSSLTAGTRAYWTLKYFSHRKIALLDGGQSKWAKEQRPLTAAVSTVWPSNYVAGPERHELFATTDEVVQAIRDRRTRLVDGRTGDYYLGQIKSGDVRVKGHIPRSALLSHTDLVNDDTTFKSVAELHDLAQSFMIVPNQPAITYCNTGHLGSGAWFVMSELMGNPNVALYDASMHGWTKDPAYPVTSEWEMR